MWIVLTVLLCAGVFFTNLAPFLILEATESLPVIIYSAIFSFVMIDLLVPNPRSAPGVMWLYWESMEHLAFPLLLLGFSAAFSAYPIIFQLSIFSVLLVLYGFTFGRMESGKDIAKTLILVNMLLAFWSLPTFVMWIDYACGIKGILTWTFLSIVTVFSYMKTKRRMIGS